MAIPNMEVSPIIDNWICNLGFFDPRERNRDEFQVNLLSRVYFLINGVPSVQE